MLLYMALLPKQKDAEIEGWADDWETMPIKVLTENVTVSDDDYEDTDLVPNLMLSKPLPFSEHRTRRVRLLGRIATKVLDFDILDSSEMPSLEDVIARLCVRVTHKPGGDDWDEVHFRRR
jgi:hypothetical protein